MSFLRLWWRSKEPEKQENSLEVGLSQDHIPLENDKMVKNIAVNQQLIDRLLSFNVVVVPLAFLWWYNDMAFPLYACLTSLLAVNPWVGYLMIRNKVLEKKLKLPSLEVLSDWNEDVQSQLLANDPTQSIVELEEDFQFKKTPFWWFKRVQQRIIKVFK